MPTDPNAPNQFDLARKRAAQQNQSQVQASKDAMTRRFAKLGGLNRGVAMKQNQMIEDNAAKNLAQQNEGIDVAQANEALRVREIQEGRDFARSEREASQMFSRGEREGSQGFAAEQARLGREFQTSERLGTEQFQSARMGDELEFKKFLEANRQSDFASQLDMAKQQFELDKEISMFNKWMAENSKDGQFAKFRGGLGGKLTTKGLATGLGDMFGR